MSSIQRKISIAILVICWIVIYQFSKEIFAYGRVVLADFYTSSAGKLFLTIFKDKLHFNAGEPDWIIKILYTLVYVPLYMAIVHLYFNHKQSTRLMFYIIGFIFGGAMVFNILGKVLHYENMVTMSRNTNDLIVSPFMLVFLIPVLKMQENIRKQQVEKS